MPGQRITIRELHGLKGRKATVVGLIDRGVRSDSITNMGMWTVEEEDGLRREVQRHYIDARPHVNRRSK